MADSTIPVTDPGGTAATGALREALASHPFFSGLPPAQLAALTDCARPRSVAAGDILFHEGGDADRFFVLTRGTVCVESKCNGRALVLQTLHEGEILGWSWLTPPFRWAFDARCAAPTEVVEVDAARLRSAFTADPGFGYHVVSRFAAVMGERLRAAHMRMLEREA